MNSTNLLESPITILKNINHLLIDALLAADIKTIGDLVNASEDKVIIVLNTVNVLGYSQVRSALMNMGFVFSFDAAVYEEYNIPNDYIFRRIDTLPLSNKTIISIIHNGITFLGDLLITDYNELLNARNVGAKTIRELKDYVHSLGYTFPNEKESYQDSIKRYQSNGILLVGEELGLSNSVAYALYRVGIFTVADLKAYGPMIFKVPGIGPKAQEEITLAMSNQGLKFESIKKDAGDNTLGIEEAQENIAIKTRLEAKERIANILERLLQERNDLLAKEKVLDEKIAHLIENYKALEINNGTGR